MLIDEATPNTSDYLEAQNTSEKELFTYGNMVSGVESIKGVKVGSYAKKTEVSNSRLIKHLCRSGSTDYQGSELALAEDDKYQSEIWETDPNTAAAWIKSGVDAAEFGIEVTT